MRKFNYWFLCFVIGICFIFSAGVDAEVKDIIIESVVVSEKSTGVTLSKEPVIEGLVTNLGVNFYQVGDFVEYKIVIKNNGESDILIRDRGKVSSVDKDYVLYEFSWNDSNDDIIEVGSSEELNLKVIYDKEVEDVDLNDNDKFVEDRNIVITLEESDVKELLE